MKRTLPPRTWLWCHIKRLFVPLSRHPQSTPMDRVFWGKTLQHQVSRWSLCILRLLMQLARHFQSFWCKALNELRFLCRSFENISATVLSTIYRNNTQREWNLIHYTSYLSSGVKRTYQVQVNLWQGSQSDMNIKLNLLISLHMAFIPRNIFNIFIVWVSPWIMVRFQSNQE